MKGVSEMLKLFVVRLEVNLDVLRAEEVENKLKKGGKCRGKLGFLVSKLTPK